MSDTTASPDLPTHEGQPSTDTNPQPTPAQDIDWKAKAREWESRAKANKTAADELATIKESQKTEAEKATERLATAERKVAEAEARVLRRDVAIEHKLAKADAALLDTITSEDAMRALAVRLGGQAADEKKHGAYVPREGATTTTVEGEAVETVRELFAG
ncbi:MAG TPA: hypothetical protein VIK12_03690 [Pengzhenrongella sp.]